MRCSYSHHHFSVFFLTFFSYAFFHATRKTFSNIKSTIEEEWTPSFHNASIGETLPNKVWNSHRMFNHDDNAEIFLGLLDTIFMSSYAIGLFISGFIGDRINMRLVLTFGMCASSVVIFIFGTLTEWLGFYNKYFYVAFWILNGLLQSTGWPTVVAVMGNWFGKSGRGLIMGIWSSCASVGNIIGALLSAAVLDYGYEYTFLVTCSLLFAGGICIFCGLINKPSEVGLPEPSEDVNIPENDLYDPLMTTDNEDSEHCETSTDEVNSQQCESTTENPQTHSKQAIGLLQAILLPGVIPYSLAYACLKLVNYAFFFWLPFYLTEALHWRDTVADDISTWYDVGGIVGGILGGVISDKIGKRSPVVVVMLVFAIPSMFLYSNSPNNLNWNALLMGVTGFFIGGPANIISAAITADLGMQEPIKDNSKALATVTGIVDGTGSIGAALGQIIVPILQEKYDWHWVFYFFMIMTCLTILCILQLFIREMRTTRFGQFLTRGICGRENHPLIRVN